MSAQAKPERVKSTSDVTFRWVDVHATARDTEAFRRMEEDFERIEAILSVRGWASLNRATSRVLIAEDAQGAIVAFIVFQMVPYTGPLFVAPSRRGSGVAEEMCDRMFQWLGEMQVRGWIATAESAHAAEIMEKYGMKKMDAPLYVMPNPGGLEI